MIKCCMFDLDGTLLNTLPTIAYYVNKTLQKYEFGIITEDECKSFVGNGAKLLIHRALAKFGGCAPELEEKIFKSYLAEYDTAPYYLTEPYEGIVPLISSLRERGMMLAVISNKQNSATVSAISHFFGDSFSVVRGGIDGVPLKPDPAAPLAILDLLCITPGETVYIGDTGVDMKTGKNMGAALTVGVLWGFRERDEIVASGADITVDTPMQIQSAVNAL